MDSKQFKFYNSTAFAEDVDFLIFFERWNDWGFTNICRIDGKNSDIPVHLSASFRVIDAYGDNNKLHGHVLSEYSNKVFSKLPSSYYSIFTDVKGCESILLCLSPSERQLLIKSLNICFTDSSFFNTLKETQAFIKSVLRDRSLEDVIAAMNKCQELLTSPLDIRLMIERNIKR